MDSWVMLEIGGVENEITEKRPARQGETGEFISSLSL